MRIPDQYLPLLSHPDRADSTRHLLTYLLERIDLPGFPDTVTIRIGQRALAAACGISDITVRHVLRQLEAAGVITRHNPTSRSQPASITISRDGTIDLADHAGLDWLPERIRAAIANNARRDRQEGR